MRRKLNVSISVTLLAGLLTVSVAAQSLGEYARQQRAQKPATPVGARVYTNDNLPTSGGLSEVGAASGPAASSTSASSAAASKSEERKEDRGKLEAEWRSKFKEQKQKIALLERELAVRQSENQSQNVRYVMIFGKVAEDYQKNQDEINQKQKELDEAKQKLEDMREELRKAGFPASWAD